MANDTVSPPQPPSFDLVIIGGGPTGLFSALLAQKLGLTVRVFDAKSGPLDLGRADALNARTQQYFQVAGILDELLSSGISCNTSSTFADGDFKSRQNRWWTSLEHCLHPNFLMIGQPVIESMLQDKLDADTVVYKENVVSVSEYGGRQEDTTGGVLVTTDTGKIVHGKYAIAADGARSAIRNLLDISFTGTKPEMVWAVLDTFIDTDFPVCSEIITFQLEGQSRVSWIPRERGMARFYVLLDKQITLELAQDSIRRHMTPYRVDFVKTEWFSTFDVKERIASTFISQNGDGRILLAGDAAHVHSVNGGQGLNTGIADAFTLAWRIATVIKQEHELLPGAKARILRSYDIERRAIAQDVINVAAALVRDTMFTAKQYVATIERNSGYITGMGVSYNSVGSGLISYSNCGIWTAGKRCPDIIVRNQELGELRLYSTLTYGKFLVLTIGDTNCDFIRMDKQCIYYALLSGKTPVADDLASHGIPKSSREFLGNVFVSDVVGQNESFMVVVRPDMYVGYVGDVVGYEKYMGYLFSTE